MSLSTSRYGMDGDERTPLVAGRMVTSVSDSELQYDDDEYGIQAAEFLSRVRYFSPLFSFFSSFLLLRFLSFKIRAFHVPSQTRLLGSGRCRKELVALARPSTICLSTNPIVLSLLTGAVQRRISDRRGRRPRASLWYLLSRCPCPK